MKQTGKKWNLAPAKFKKELSEKVSESISKIFTITACRDPKDNKFLELAVAAKASCIITGDKDLLELHPFRGIPILTVNDFLNDF